MCSKSCVTSEVSVGEKCRVPVSTQNSVRQVNDARFILQHDCHVALIDDLDQAMDGLSPLGIMLLRDSVARLRVLLNRHAMSSGWYVLPYEAFIAWSQRLIADEPVLVADKLYPEASLCGPVFKVSTHRHWIEETATREAATSVHVIPALQNLRLTILDDAAYTGTTLENLFCLAIRSGAIPVRVVTAAVSIRCKQALTASAVKIEALITVPDSCDIMHARDFFPWLPYSGRRILNTSVPDTTSERPRLSPLFYRDGLWLELAGHRTGDQLRALSLDVLIKFETYLGRRATVADTGLLGQEVAVPIASPAKAALAKDPSTSLVELLRRGSAANDRIQAHAGS